MRRAEDPCRDPASEARDDWADIERELDECLARSLRDWRPLPGDPDELCPPPSEEERRENARAIQALSVPDRFALMFGKRPPTETDDQARDPA